MTEVLDGPGWAAGFKNQRVAGTYAFGAEGGLNPNRKIIRHQINRPHGTLLNRKYPKARSGHTTR